MSVWLSLGYFILGVLVILSSRMVTTTLHELGHAIPALWLSRGPVKVFVGSYGDEAGSTTWRLGRLHLFFKWNITDWNLGVCVHTGVPRLLDQLLIVLGGPLFSLIFGSVLLLFIGVKNLEAGAIFFLAFFVLSAIWDFFVNIIPHHRPLPMFDGSLCYNDGYQLRQLWRSAHYPPAYTQALQHLDEANYAAAIPLLQQVIKAGHTDRELYHLLAQTYWNNREPDQVLRSLVELMEQHPLRPEDQGLVAAAYQQKGQYAQAIHFYNQALYIDFKNPRLRFQRGLTHLQAGDHAEALQDFERAHHNGARSAELHAYWGLALLRRQALAEAKTQLDHAHALDPESALVHLHLAFYYQQKQERDRALQHLDRARDLGSTYHGMAMLRDELSR
ncbi:MAG: M50 family metallopeptidase [Bacteroidota bacterium]